ncbi:MAG: hypothetical protein ABI725_06010 [Chloroflexota bacterium]
MSTATATGSFRSATYSLPSAGCGINVVSNQWARAAELSAAITESDQRLSGRLDDLEAIVNQHDDLIQQLRGARSLLTMVFGVSLLTAVLGLLTLVEQLR